MRGDNPKQYRVLNLIRNVNLETASPKKRAVIGLLMWQPLAERIRFEDRCALSRCAGIMLSYRLPKGERLHGDDRESCGYWCSRCDFGNAGSRPIRQPKFNQTTKAG